MTGLKYDDQKVRMDLLDPEALTEMAAVLTYGAQKYDAHNWRKGIVYSRIIAAILRHLFAWIRGERLDPETSRSHLAHVGVNVMFLLWFEKNRPDLDDMWKG